MTEQQAMRMALEYVESVPDDRCNADQIDRDALITALRQALEQQDSDCQRCGGKGCVACDARKQQPADEHKPWCHSRTFMLSTFPKKPAPCNCKLEQQPADEPVAWMWYVNNGAGYVSRGIGFHQTDIPFAKHTPLYTRPQPAAWVGLTDEEIMDVAFNFDVPSIALRTIEAKLKEKNT